MCPFLPTRPLGPDPVVTRTAHRQPQLLPTCTTRQSPPMLLGSASVGTTQPGGTDPGQRRGKFRPGLPKQCARLAHSPLPLGIYRPTACPLWARPQWALLSRVVPVLTLAEQPLPGLPKQCAQHSRFPRRCHPAACHLWDRPVSSTQQDGRERLSGWPPGRLTDYQPYLHFTWRPAPPGPVTVGTAQL